MKNLLLSVFLFVSEYLRKHFCDIVSQNTPVHEKAERFAEKPNMQMDTKDILFICGGAFIDLEKTVSER